MVLNIGYDSTNYYLIPLPNHQYLLIDCGWPGTLTKLRNQLKRYGIELSSVKYLVLTHFHPDHSGIAEDLRSNGCTVILEEKQLPFAGQSKQYYKAAMLYLELDTTKVTVISSETSRPFFRELGIDAEVLNTPGHSDDSISLALYCEGVFTGDLHRPNQVAEELIEPVNESWNKIGQTGLMKIFPGHGPSLVLNNE